MSLLLPLWQTQTRRKPPNERRKGNVALGIHYGHVRHSRTTFIETRKLKEPELPYLLNASCTSQVTYSRFT